MDFGFEKIGITKEDNKSIISKKVRKIFMGILLVIIGLGWLIGTILKEEVFTKPVPPNTDYRQAFIDLNTGKISAKECDKRMTNGYYVKK